MKIAEAMEIARRAAIRVGQAEQDLKRRRKEYQEAIGEYPVIKWRMTNLGMEALK